MTTPENETLIQYMLRMADDGGGGLADEATFQSNIETSFGDLGTVYTDTGDLPADASIRANGTFTDAYSAKRYLLDGGLLGGDDSLDIITLGLTYFIKAYDELLQDYTYTVYIRRDSP